MQIQKINRSTDTIKSINIPDIQWEQGETIDYKIKILKQGNKLTIDPNATFKFQVWSTSNPAVAIINKDSTSIDYDNSEVLISLTDEDTNITAGSYKCQLAIFIDAKVASYARANLTVQANPLGDI
jgi:hypothetical protein